jgi:hypothetical protein
MSSSFMTIRTAQVKPRRLNMSENGKIMECDFEAQVKNTD